MSATFHSLLANIAGIASRRRNEDHTRGTVKKNKRMGQGFHFLDLPAELRVEVYDLLEAVPDHSTDTDHSRPNEYHGFAKTRKSLLLTCRQINVEFTPHFFRSTTFCLRFATNTPRDFIALLSTFPHAKTVNIRHVEYRKNTFASTALPWPRRLVARFQERKAQQGSEDFHSLMALFDLVAGSMLGHRQPTLHLSTLNIVHSPFEDFYYRCPKSGPPTFLWDDWTQIGLSESLSNAWAPIDNSVLVPAMKSQPVRRERPSYRTGFRVFYRRDKATLDAQLHLALGYVPRVLPITVSRLTRPPLQREDWGHRPVSRHMSLSASTPFMDSYYDRADTRGWYDVSWDGHSYYRVPRRRLYVVNQDPAEDEDEGDEEGDEEDGDEGEDY